MLARQSRVDGVAHRDLKCENILLDGAGRLQVCDFGMTKFFQGGYAPAPVAPMAPTMPMGPPAMPGAPPMPGAPGAGGAAQYLMKTTTVAVSTEALRPALVAWVAAVAVLLGRWEMHSSSTVDSGYISL